MTVVILFLDCHLSISRSIQTSLVTNKDHIPPIDLSYGLAKSSLVTECAGPITEVGSGIKQNLMSFGQERKFFFLIQPIQGYLPACA